jgi:hypothetical protein
MLRRTLLGLFVFYLLSVCGGKSENLSVSTAWAPELERHFVLSWLWELPEGLKSS